MLLNILDKNIKMNHQNIETAVIIEKEIENLNSYEKIDQFIGLCNFCYLNRC